MLMIATLVAQKLDESADDEVYQIPSFGTESCSLASLSSNLYILMEHLLIGGNLGFQG
jgi:hypothetical protein